MIAKLQSLSFGLFGLVLGTCAVSTAVHAEPVVLEPASPWVLDYADDSCALRRSFLYDGQETVLEMRQFQPGLGLMFTVYGEPLEARRRAARFNFEPGGEEQEDEGAYLIEFEGYGTGVTFSGRLDPPQGEVPIQTIVERGAPFTGLTLGGVISEELTLDTGALEAPMQALQTCMDELLTHWGIDVEAHRDLQRNVAPRDFRNWARKIVNTGYPRDMIRQGLSGTVRVRLIVGIDGRAESCTIPAAYAHPDFQEAACKEMIDHARFDPALDANGDPVRSYYVTTVSYRTN